MNDSELARERDHYRERAASHHARADWNQHVAAVAMREGLTECERLRDRAQAAEEALATIRKALGTNSDSPWPLVKVLGRLAASSDYLLDVHNSNDQGDADIRAAARSAREIVTALERLGELL